jgi:hypothetical protein
VSGESPLGPEEDDERLLRGSNVGMITVLISVTPYLVGAAALGQGYIQVIMPMHVAR